MSRPHAPSSAASLQELLDAAVELQRVHALDDAERLYREALTIAPGEPAILERLGAVLAARWTDDDEGAAAIEMLEAAAEGHAQITPENAGLFNNLGNALRRAGRYEEAEIALKRVTQALPRYWEAWHNLGQVYKNAARYDQAAAALRRAIALEPTFAENHGVLGEVLTKLGRLNAAIACFNRAMELGYRHPDVLSHLAITHRYLGELDKAEVLLREVVAMTPDSASANTNLAVVLAQQGHFEEAATYHNRAIEIDPDHILNRTNRAYARLAAGDIPGGWDDWERAIEDGPRGKERSFSGVRKWDGEDISSERLMVYREQGVGDEILFASCYADVAQRCAQLVVETDPRIATLLARSLPNATVRAQTIDAYARETLTETTRDFDVVIPAGSLPRLVRPTLAQFPSDRPSFVVPDAARVSTWQARLAAIRGPRVGISWRSKITTAERRLEYTRLTEWARIFGVEGVSFFNLQYDDCEREIAEAEARFGITIHRWPDVDYMNDFESVAALTANLDLVVSPRNAVAMLSGAIGVPTVMMGNRWDWSDLGTDTCPWLPAITLVYRELGQEWDDVLATAASRVESLVTPSSASTPH